MQIVFQNTTHHHPLIYSRVFHFCFFIITLQNPPFWEKKTKECYHTQDHCLFFLHMSHYRVRTWSLWLFWSDVWRVSWTYISTSILMQRVVWLWLRHRGVSHLAIKVNMPWSQASHCPLVPDTDYMLYWPQCQSYGIEHYFGQKETNFVSIWYQQIPRIVRDRKLF